ncbi:MAG: hypothetical protein ACREOO_02640 [bacterium]
MAEERWLKIGGDDKLFKIGGTSALLYVGLSVAGNLMHTAMPPTPAGALETIAGSGTWKIAHIILTSTYFFIVPMLIAVAATFKESSPIMRIAVPMILVCAAVGIVQISTHLTIFHHLAHKYVAAADPMVKANVILIYETLWPFNVALEIAHLLVIYTLIIAIGFAMLHGDFPKWVAWAGITGGAVAVAGIIIGEIILSGSGGLLGDRIFGLSLLPLMVWLLAVGVNLLKR